MRSSLPFAVALLLACLASLASPARAQDDDPDDERTVIDRWADAMAESLARRWTGPVVDWPAPSPRPEAAGVMRSIEHPVNVHVGPRVTAERATAALAALEMAYDYLEAHRWPMPMPDGGRGGTAGFDLYLVESEGEPVRPVHPGYDVPHIHEGLDATVPFVRVDDDLVADSRLDSCVVSAFVQATLLGLDPAEAASWRIATGDYVAWLVTGHWGCSDEGVVAQQRESYRTWIGDDARSGEGGALFLAMLSARTDGLTGNFIRDLWTAAPQRTWEGDQLRAAPDMWQVVHAVMEIGRDPLDRFLEEVAVSRYFAGPEARRDHAPLALLRGLPETAAVPVQGHTAFEDLPRRFEPRDLELEPYGSAYVLVDTSEAPAGSLLRIWLRGELGVGWALAAVRIGADGAERGRVRAPVRVLNPRSYIPLELTDDQTEQVLIVVTSMGSRLADADEPNDQVRSFRLILDRGPSE
ncbi:MAG: hypothetical protein H6719_20690 [Sandaracinaceae bacterium]|nr:hypothetical protein [Sandaracinaceae bacterium]